MYAEQADAEDPQALLLRSPSRDDLLPPQDRGTAPPRADTRVHNRETLLRRRHTDDGPAPVPSAPASGGGDGTTYYTYKTEVPLLPGQTLGFTTGKGYYPGPGRV